tara:strand:- start:5304 stop:5483 length:180 start_codon:yes stop_codon:yes gene_type:complete
MSLAKKDEEIFTEGISLLMKKHRITFSEAFGLALHYVENRPGMLSYMVQNWNHPTNQGA